MYLKEKKNNVDLMKNRIKLFCYRVLRKCKLLSQIRRVEEEGHETIVVGKWISGSMEIKFEF